MTQGGFARLWALGTVARTGLVSALIGTVMTVSTVVWMWISDHISSGLFLVLVILGALLQVMGMVVVAGFKIRRRPGEG